MMPESLTGVYIKHKNAMDVCYLVRKVSRQNGSLLYDLTILNMGFEKSWIIDKCKAEDIDLDNFLYYADEAECLRNVNWQEIK